jgi:predicted metalloprotease
MFFSAHRNRNKVAIFFVFVIFSICACAAPKNSVSLISSANPTTTSIAIENLDLPYNEFLPLAIDDLEKFWENHYSDVYLNTYSDLVGGVHAADPNSTEAMPSGCDYTGDYTYVEDNAFYCDEGDFIVYDDAKLFPEFADQFGPLVTAVILAHEWGHAIQSPARNDVMYSLRSTTIELQADCFAGAWVGHVQIDTIDGLSFSEADITGALLGMMQIGDSPGDSSYDANAHGSGFDRVSAFQDGFVGGLTPCAEYETTEPEPVQFGFSPDELSRPSPGDFPFDQDMFTSLGHDLTLFWTATVAADVLWTPPTLIVDSSRDAAAMCTDGLADLVVEGVHYCNADSTVIIDETVARNLYTDTPGDFAVGYLAALGFAEAVQRATQSSLSGYSRLLLDSCYAGMWAGDIIPLNTNPVVVPTEAEPRIALSPGDLDEAVRAALTLSDVQTTGIDLGSPFARVDAFRQGVLHGADGCTAVTEQIQN